MDKDAIKQVILEQESANKIATTGIERERLVLIDSLVPLSQRHHYFGGAPMWKIDSYASNLKSTMRTKSTLLILKMSVLSNLPVRFQCFI